VESQLANTQLNMRMVTNVAVVAVPVDSGSLGLLLTPMTQLESETQSLDRDDIKTVKYLLNFGLRPNVNKTNISLMTL